MNEIKISKNKSSNICSHTPKDSLTYFEMCTLHFGHYCLSRQLHILIQETDMYPFHELDNIYFLKDQKFKNETYKRPYSTQNRSSTNISYNFK